MSTARPANSIGYAGIGSRALQNEQDENAHVDDAHHAIAFSALAEQVEVQARAPDRQAEGVCSKDREEQKLERRFAMKSDEISHGLDRRPTVEALPN